MSIPAPRPLDREPETIAVPATVRFPVELTPPPAFDPADPDTWPDVAGRLEWVAGRLLFMPPGGDAHGDTVMDVGVVLGTWVRAHPDYVVGGGEAGVRLAGDTRGADAAVWRRAEVGAYTGRFRTVAPLLAVEVTGFHRTEATLREKARWYLQHGVAVVWIVVPGARQVVVVTASGETRHGAGDVLPAHPALPDLVPAVGELLFQTSR